jgi:hypothetical protein
MRNILRGSTFLWIFVRYFTLYFIGMVRKPKPVKSRPKASLKWERSSCVHRERCKFKGDTYGTATITVFTSVFHMPVGNHNRPKEMH